MKYTRPKVWVRLFHLKVTTEEPNKYIVVCFFILKYNFTIGNEYIILIWRILEWKEEQFFWNGKGEKEARFSNVAKVRKERTYNYQFKEVIF